METPTLNDDIAMRCYLFQYALIHTHSVPPAAVPAIRNRSIKDVGVGHEEHSLGAEDDDVECCRGQGEEEHFELKAHPEKDSTCDK